MLVISIVALAELVLMIVALFNNECCTGRYVIDVADCGTGRASTVGVIDCSIERDFVGVIDCFIEIDAVGVIVMLIILIVVLVEPLLVLLAAALLSNECCTGRYVIDAVDCGIGRATVGVIDRSIEREDIVGVIVLLALLIAALRAKANAMTASSA